MLKIAEFFIRRPRVAYLTLALVVLMGVLIMSQLKRQADPSVDINTMSITTTYPGASPKDVEINVTDPIEDELVGIEDVEEMTSNSMENVSFIHIAIDPDSPHPERVKQDIRDAVDRVTDLPAAVTEKPKVTEIRSSNLPAMEIAIMGEAPESELRKHAKDLEDMLTGAKGVGTIEKVGYRKKEIHIAADPAKLLERYVSLGEIMHAIRARNVRTTGGSLDSYVSEKKIVTFSEYDDPMDVRDVIIRSTFSGSKVKVTDIAVVSEGFEDYTVIPKADGYKAISFIIRAQENADVITLSKNIKQILDVFRRGLPEGVVAEIMYDNSDYTKSLLSLVRSNGLMGFILVLIVILLFLDWKSAFWTALGIPISICGAFIFFPFLGLTINQVTLSSMVLVLGMLVDNSIVISENSYRLKEKGFEPVTATMMGLKEVYMPIVASVLTTVLAFLPMLFMTGIVGKFVVSVPIVVVLMLGWSLIESVWFLPGHIAHIVPSKKKPITSRHVMPWLTSFYRAKLVWALRHRKAVLSAFMVVFLLVTALSMVLLKFIIFPVTNPDSFFVIAELPVGSSLERTAERMKEVEAVVQEAVPADAMRSYITRVGMHFTSQYSQYFEVTGGNDNYAMVVVNLLPAGERTIAAEEIILRIKQKLRDIKGFDKLYIKLPESGPPVGKPINIIYISDDDALRQQFEEKTIDFLKNVKGVYGVESDNILGKDELRLKLDYDEMAKLGITAIDVARTVRAAFDGEVVTSIRREGEEIDFRVRLIDPKKYQEEGVLKLEIANDRGKLVPLGSFAHFDEAQTSAQMNHYDGRRSVTVSGEIDTDVITSSEVNERIKAEFEPKAMQHAGFMMKLEGEQDKTEESMASFYMALAVALVVIFFVLVVLFDSFTQPLLIMSAIPLGIIGVMITFMIHGLPIGFIALIGTLGLTGVVVNTSIVMISTINEQCKCEGGKSFQAIIEAASIRFRPVILTTLTTVVGLLPTAYGIGGDLPFIRPMVLAMAWGLAFATFISLLFIPLIYAVQGGVKE